jgi:acyl-coenzyme A thioesterase PaaI-like protein
MDYEFIRSQLDKSVPFAKHAGVEVEKIEKGRATAYLPFRPEGLNHIGTQHAAALFTLGEVASGAAVAGAFAPVLLEVRPVAAEATIRFLSLAKGPVRAVASVTGDPGELMRSVKADGKATFRVNVALSSEDQRNVGEMTVDWHVSMKKK